MMIPITEAGQVARYGGLFGEMMLKRDGEECEFSPAWLSNHGWMVVPAESMARIPPADIPRIVAALRELGYASCTAVFNEPGYIRALPAFVPTDPPSNMPTCYRVTVDEADFGELNRTLGLFRFILAAEDRSWAISCTEWYNLFAGAESFLEALLGRPIERARQEFMQFASLMARGNSGDPLVQTALRYAVV